MLDALHAAISDLTAIGPETLGDAGSVALHRLLAQLEAVTTRATAAFDASREWEADGAQTAAQWVATECGLPRGTARGRLALGRHLRHLPVLEQAWLDGDITAAHVRVVAHVRRPATADALARDERLLASNASRLRFEAFCRTVAYWEQWADPDGADEAEEARTARRGVQLDQSYGGMYFGRITLDPIGGTIVADELERRERALFDADWAEARRRTGREPTALDLARTAAQRRADALVQMAVASRTAPEGGRRPAPLFSVLVDYGTFSGRICELANGTVVSPVALVPWLAEAEIERAVFGPDRRVEVGRRARLFGGATRRAIELRDRCCQHPYCDVPGDRCQADHIVPYEEGGLTTQDNGRLACAFHNRGRAGGRRPRAPDG